VAVVRLPRMSNATDVDALALEPGVAVSVTTDPDVIASADVAVLPGSRATVDDLDWLRRRGIADVIATRVGADRPVLGICGGYQMLAERIDDPVESGLGAVSGLGLLPVEVTFHADKRLGRPNGSWAGHPVTAYEIHHGVARLTETAGSDVEAFLDGYRRGPVWGTTWHGALENDGFRRAFLCDVASAAGRDFTPAPDVGFAALREARLDALGDLVERHLDTDAVWRLIEQGIPARLPVIPPGGPVT
jgi:adenosylcobyric acid synthase